MRSQGSSRIDGTVPLSVDGQAAGVPMLELYLFGRPRLMRAGSASNDVPVQGLSLALLAALAVAAPRGLTRDRVLSLLWPPFYSAHRLLMATHCAQEHRIPTLRQRVNRPQPQCLPQALFRGCPGSRAITPAITTARRCSISISLSSKAKLPTTAWPIQRLAWSRRAKSL
jgi:hypothetical protein